MRDHQAIAITEFNGLWSRGDSESAPLDHFTECENIEYIHSGFKTRQGIDVFEVEEETTIHNVRRLYTYVHQDDEGLLVLDELGNIYHTESPTPTTPILTIATMTDFAFVSFAERAYISPSNGITGLQNEFLYVYLGNGAPARKAAGNKPVGTLTAALGPFPGKIENGIHVFGVLFETDTGFLTAPAAFATTPTPVIVGTKITLTNIPISPSGFVVKRHIVATKFVNPVDYTGNLEGYQFFFIPNGEIPDNTTTTLVVDFYDAELLEDASHLIDNFEEIPAFVALNLYHNRLIGVAEYGDPLDEEDFGKVSTARVSFAGEPEAISQVDGLIVAPLEGNPLTNAQEYRDVLYLFKATRTYAYTDNGDAPSSWPLTIVDQGIGASVHGIATVLDSGGINIEFIIVVSFTGLVIFNGAYQHPELSWKIETLWSEQPHADFKGMQIVNDTVTERIYVNLPDFTVLFGDYTNGLDPKNIKWGIWRFDGKVTSLALLNVNQLILGFLGPMTE